MADMVKAIELEKEYISHRIKGEEPWHLVDKIKECGFETLEQYFAEKKNHEFGLLSFEVIETTPLKAIADVLQTIAQRKTAALFADTPFTLVWNGNNGEYNIEYCLQNKIPILPLQTGGGTIVSTKGDLNIGICVPQTDGVNEAFILKGLADIFKKHTDKTVEINGNDILIDGFKVLGSSTYRMAGMLMFITPVSLTEKTDLIANICLKQSKKIPKHIDFMDGKTLKREVSEWLKIQ